MSDVLWQWPAQTRLDRPIPKTKFYEKAKVSTRVREAFVADVERITWAHKLSPQTITLAGTRTVPEIQVFAVEAKPGREISGAVLDVIDAAVQTPIIFEEYGSDGVRTRAAGKVPGVKGPKLGARFTGEWLLSDASRRVLPQALDLSGLYSQLLSPLFPLEARPGEALSETLGRIADAQALAHQIKALEARMAKEKQLNRKMEIRRELRERMSEYDTVTRVASHEVPHRNQVGERD
jgi:hypothetical protein